jgi:hypothetical protein
MSQGAGARAFAWDATRRVRADADAKGYATPGGLKSRPHEQGAGRAQLGPGVPLVEAKLGPPTRVARRPLLVYGSHPRGALFRLRRARRNELPGFPVERRRRCEPPSWYWSNNH